MNTLLISPHSDDACLFAAFTCMREKPLVLTVTDSFVQQNRGEKITPDQRRIEDIKAMDILGCPLVFGGIRDDILDVWALQTLFVKFQNFDVVYGPTPLIPGGNPHHNLIGEVAQAIFGTKFKGYMTYTTDKLYLEGAEEIQPSEQELALKDSALSCYVSQLTLPATAPHFAAMKGKSEWLI